MMGRPERPIDRATTPIAAFAADLRALRDSAGTPSYRALAQRTHYSVSTLSQAAAGRSLPTLPVLRAFVTACDGDPAEWEHKWQALSHADAAATHEAIEAPVIGDEPAAQAELEQQDRPPVTAAGLPVRRHNPVRRDRRMTAIYALVMVVSVAGVLAMWARPDTRSAAVTSVSSHRVGAADPVADGSDPNRAGCGPDAVTLATTNVHFPAATLAGRLELRYSPHCRAAWSRFEPADGWVPGAGVVITVWTIRPADQATQSYTVPYGGETIIGNMLMTAKGCIAAELSMVQGPDTSPVATTLCLAIGS